MTPSKQLPSCVNSMRDSATCIGEIKIIDTKELRRKLRSDDLVDHVDIHANVKPVLTELLNRLEAWEEVFGHLGTPDEVGNEWHALSARLEAAEKSDAESLMMYRKARDERDELRAKIVEMERQEPVATVIKEGDSRYWMSERLWTFPDGKYPLYALPGAQGE